VVSVDGFAGRLPLDTGAVLDRVVDQVVQRFASQGLPPGLAGRSPEDIVAAAVADWIGRILLPPPVDDVIDVPSLSEPEPDAPSPWEDLLDRNAELAAALGACECWGEDEACLICFGEGGAGWVRPDRRLYARYVRHAVRRQPAPADRGHGPTRRYPAPPAHLNGSDRRGDRDERHMDR
jgi:hypothetical protein